MPHDTMTLKMNVVLPDNPTAAFYYLKLLFEDKADYQFYEKTYPIKVSESYSMLAHFEDGNVTKPTKMGNTIFGGNYQFEFSNDSAFFQLKNKDGNILITRGPYARTGRKPSISQIAAINKKNNEKHMISNQFLWTKAETKVKTEGNQELTIDYRYLPDTSNQSYISGEVEYHFANNGCIEVSYRFIPQGIEEALETGISFQIPSALTEFRWVGKGPYAAYPGKDRLSEFGIYHLNRNDLYFPGNRQDVYCAVFSDTIGNGFALIANKANISVERTNAGIMVSHNSHVSGRFNKYNWPDDLYSFQDDKTVAGSFAIIPLTSEWPEILKMLFGDYKNKAKVFQPFYHSYDQ
jgi:beta-galactosidase